MASRKMLIDGEESQSNLDTAAHYDFDLFVIGAGSGGVRAARFSSNFGAKVGICELPFHPISSEVIGGVGGTCVIRGCVPKKILVYGASFGSEIEDARNYGWEVNERVDFNWKKLLQKKTDEILRLNNIYKRLLSNAGVKLYEGEGKVVGPNEVEVTQLDGTKLSYSAKHILIATGSRAQRPNIPGKFKMASISETERREPVNEQAIANLYASMRTELNQIYTKITELEMEVSEHSLVINAIQPLDPKRRCYRMIGGVLVERTIKEVLPAVQRNKEGIEEVIGRLNEALEKKKKEIAEFETKYKIRIRKSDNDMQDDSNKKEGNAQGVLVGPAGGSES